MRALLGLVVIGGSVLNYGWQAGSHGAHLAAGVGLQALLAVVAAALPAGYAGKKVSLLIRPGNLTLTVRFTIILVAVVAAFACLAVLGLNLAGVMDEF